MFTQAELGFLADQRIGRLATVAPTGQVQNNPVGFFIDAAASTITIGGHALGASRKFRNVQQGTEPAGGVDLRP